MFAFRFRKAAPWCAAFFLAACATAGMERVTRDAAGVTEWAAQRGFGPLSLGRTGRFDLLALARWSPVSPASTLTVYIEGDGAPWLSTFHPPPDPTPVRPLALGLASAQPEGAVVYLARPCQYLATNESCGVEYWTNRRFSEEVVAAYGQALDHLAARTPGRRFRLVGYSGGGIIALALLARRQDIDQVVTVATPVDLEGWIRHHGLTGFSGAIAPLPSPGDARWQKVLHLAGAADKVVPPANLRAAVSRLWGRLVEVDGFDHECCWVGNWPRLWRDLVRKDGDGP